MIILRLNRARSWQHWGISYRIVDLDKLNQEMCARANVELFATTRDKRITRSGIFFNIHELKKQQLVPISCSCRALVLTSFCPYTGFQHLTLDSHFESITRCAHPGKSIFFRCMFWLSDIIDRSHSYITDWCIRVMWWVGYLIKHWH